MATPIRNLAQFLFEALNSRNLTELELNLAEDAVFDFPGTEIIQGRKKILLFFKILFRRYPRLTFTVDEIIVEGDQACALWSNEGEDQKGTPYSNRGVTLVRMKDGKIVFMSDFFKDTSFVEA